MNELMCAEYVVGEYTCSEWASDVWYVLTSVKIGCTKEPSSMKNLKRIKEKISPCVVIMSGKGISPHMGIYKDGRLFHLTPDGAFGHEFDSATRAYREQDRQVRFYVNA